MKIRLYHLVNELLKGDGRLPSHDRAGFGRVSDETVQFGTSPHERFVHPRYQAGSGEREVGQRRQRECREFPTQETGEGGGGNHHGIVR